MNHFIWLLGLLIIAYLLRHWYRCPGRLAKKRPAFDSYQKIVVFDLHGVLLSRSYFGMAKHILKHSYRLDLFFLCLKPSFLKDVGKLLKKSRVPEEFMLKLSEKHTSLAPLIDVVITIMNEQQVIPTMLELVKKLKKNGYKLYLFSNIGEKTFTELTKKFPQLFSNFDGIAVVEQQDDWIQKPSPAAFTKFLARFGLKAGECVFIDNSYRNIKTALQEGFYPILFHDPDQVTYELKLVDIQ